MSDNPNTRGIFVKGGDIFADIDQLELVMFSNHLNAKYGGNWKFSHRTEGTRLLDRDHFEDGYFLFFERTAH